MNALINDAARLWWQWMAPMFWQASLLILLISLIDWAVRKWIWPQMRYVLWLLVLLKLVVPPQWGSPTSPFSRMEPHVMRSIQENRIAPGLLTKTTPIPKPSAGGDPNPALVRLPSGSGAAAYETTAAGRPVSGLTVQAWILLAWLAGMFLFTALLFLKMAKLRRWHRQQRERRIPKWFHELLVRTAGTLGLKQLPAIVFAKDAATPAVYGLFRPVLLLPAGYPDRLSREEAEYVLLHELCHLKRGDLWLHGLYLILHVVYWFNPFLIWTRRQMKHVREICCDLSVAGVLRERTKGYRQTLLNTARELLTETVEPGLGLLGLFEEPFRLVARLKWLEKGSWKHRRWIAAASLIAGAGMAAVMIPMSGTESTGLWDNEIVYSSPSGSGLTRSEEAGREPKTTVPDFTVEIKLTEPMTAVILPKTGPPAPQLESAMAELMDLFKNQRIRSNGNPFFRLWSDPEKVPESQYTWEVGFPVKRNVSVKPPLEFVRVTGMQVASATIKGVFATEPVWDVFVEKIQGIGLVPAHPPAVEVYRNENDGKPFWWTTELQMQVLRPGQGYPGMHIQIRESAPAMALVLPVQGSYAQFRDKVNRVKTYIRKKDIRASDRWLCINFSDLSKVKPAEYLWEIGCEIEFSENHQVDPPFAIRHYKKDTVASAWFGGPPETEFPVTPFIIQNLLSGRMIAGPVVLSWREDPNRKNPEVEKTELLMPVQEVEGLAEKMEAVLKSMSRVGEQSWIDTTARSAPQKTPADASSPSGPENPNAGEGPAKTDWTDKMAGFLKKRFETGGPVRTWAIQKADPFWAILLPATGSYDQHPVVFEKLQNYMKINGIVATGLAFTTQYYSGEIVSGFELRWEAGYPIADSTKVKPPFTVKRFPEREFLKVHYTPSLDQRTLTVQMTSWLYHNDYRTVMPERLIWTNGIPTTMAGLKNADVEIPIKKMEAPFPEVRLFTRSDMDRRELIMLVSGSLKQEDSAILKLKRYVVENKIETLGDVFVQYHTSPEFTPEKDLVWEVGVPIKEDVRAVGPFRTEWRRGRLLACTNFEGDHLNIPVEFWWSYALNFTMSGYQASGYPRKVLLNQIQNDRWKLELQWPVKQ